MNSGKADNYRDTFGRGFRVTELPAHGARDRDALKGADRKRRHYTREAFVCISMGENLRQARNRRISPVERP